MNFQRPTGFTGSVPRNWIDNNLSRCPFCKLPSFWEQAMEFKFTSTNRYHYKCPNCQATISVSVPAVTKMGLSYLFANKNLKIESTGNNQNLQHLEGGEYTLEILQEWARQIKEEKKSE